jgi:hypothetical protein
MFLVLLLFQLTGTGQVANAEPNVPHQDVKALAQEAASLYADLKQGNRIGENVETRELARIIQEILEKHPTSREAFLIKRGRFHGMDSAFVSELSSRQWSMSGEHQAEATIASQAATSWFQAPAQTYPRPETSKNAHAVTSLATTRSRSPTMSRRDVFEQMKASSVLIIQLNPLRDGRLVWFSHGSGSFIAPNLVLTNTHVVESEDGVVGHSFLVVNRELGISRAVVRARAQAASGRGIDAAVLEVLDVRSDTIVPITAEFTEGDTAILSGFAGKASLLDQAFVDLKEMVNSGVIPTEDHIPSPKFSSGAVQAIFRKTGGEETVAADIEATGGASGSAIVNACGEMIALLYAVSTAYVDQRGKVDASTYNYSVSAREVMRWLDSARIPYSKASTPCIQY